MFDLNNIFKENLFCKLQDGCCRMSYTGEVGVKCTRNGKTVYRAWNNKTKRFIDVTGFNMPFSGLFMVVPTCSIEEDMILINDDGLPVYVIEVLEKTFKAIDYQSGHVVEIPPLHHVFFGQNVFYGRVVNLGEKIFGSGIGNMMIMSQLFGMPSPLNSLGLGGDNSSNFHGTNNDSMSQFFSMMMMTKMMDGNGMNGLSSLFEGLTDFNFDNIFAPSKAKTEKKKAKNKLTAPEKKTVNQDSDSEEEGGDE